MSASPQHASPQHDWPIPADAQSISVNGYPSAYRQAGSGVPIVLILGSIGDYRVWTSQLAAFSKRNHVVTPSLRHYYPEPWSGEGGSGEGGSGEVCCWTTAMVKVSVTPSVTR